MKIIYILLLLAICINSYSQTRRSGGYKKNHTKTYKNNLKGNELNNKINDTVPVVKPRETATERYLKGTSVKNANADTSKSTGTKSPFTSGIHPAANAGEKFDTTNGNLNVNNTNNDNVVNSPVAAPNDTIFNTNTISANNGVTTNSGAVDRSGQAQFGQTNWGNSRSTVGESQWTIPPPVSASFTKEFPSAGDLTWTRNNTDTSIYSARYKSGDTWVTTSYRVSGERLDMRTEVPLTLLPKRVSSYISKLPANSSVTTITKWQVLGKSDVYEIQTRTGKTMYVNNEGAEVNR
jgi:hypothetical protein